MLLNQLKTKVDRMAVVLEFLGFTQLRKTVEDMDSNPLLEGVNDVGVKVVVQHNCSGTETHDIPHRIKIQFSWGGDKLNVFFTERGGAVKIPPRSFSKMSELSTFAKLVSCVDSFVTEWYEWYWGEHDDNQQ